MAAPTKEKGNPPGEWAAICREVQLDLPAIRAGVEHARGDLARATRRLLSLLVSSEEDGDRTKPTLDLLRGDPEAQGVLAALTLGRLRARLLQFWISTFGPGIAIVCAMHERRLFATHAQLRKDKSLGLDLGTRWVELRGDEKIAVALDHPTWDALSAAFRRLTKADRLAAQAEVRSAREQLLLLDRTPNKRKKKEGEQKQMPLGLALWVDGVALLGEEAAEDAERVLGIEEQDAAGAASKELEPWVIALLPALASASPSKEKRAAAVLILASTPVTSVNRIAKYAKDVVRLLGVEEISAMTDLLGAAHKAHTVVEAVALKRVAEALATVEDQTVLAFFERHIESRLIGAVAAAYVVTHKRESKKTVGTAAVKATATSRAVEIHEQAALQKMVRSKRAKKAAKKIATKRKREGIVTLAREANDNEIPWILREPPWIHLQALPPLPSIADEKIPALDLNQIPFDEQLHLTEDDRAGIAEGDEVDDDDSLGMLASHGLSALPKLLEMPTLVAINGLRNVESPRAMPHILATLATPRRAIALAYLRKFPDVSALALIALALAGPVQQRRVALEAISLMLEEGNEAPLHSAALRLGPDVEEVLPAIFEGARLLDYPKDALSSAPSWLTKAKLPSLLLRLPSELGGREEEAEHDDDDDDAGRVALRLPQKSVEHVLDMLTFAGGRRPYLAALRGLHSSLDPVALDVFLVAVLDAWVRSRAWSDDWVLFAVAALGGADSHREIMKRAKEWNREFTTRERALSAIRALGAGGLSAASSLIDLTRKGGGTALAECAKEVLTALGRREGLTTDELADITIPTLDLDSSGRATLDFGSPDKQRIFEVRLGDDLAAQIFDAQGKRVVPPTTLRKLASDDPVKAQMSLERLRSLKKGMGEVARNIAARLELAMITGRTWRAQSFRTLIIDHPLLGRVARRLVWVHIKRQESPMLFRIAEDGTAADLEDELVSLDAHPSRTSSVRLVHPLELADDEKNAWAELLADYEIIQPFSQLMRPIFTPHANERETDTFSRWSGREIKYMALQGRLLARGWERVSGDGQTTGFMRRLRSASAHYELVHPMIMGEDFINETTLGSVQFGSALATVPPIVFSEIAYDLHVFGADDAALS